MVENNPPLKAERGRDARMKMKKWSSGTKRTVPAVIIPTWHTDANPDQQKLKLQITEGWRFFRFTDETKPYEIVQEKSECMYERERQRK